MGNFALRKGLEDGYFIYPVYSLILSSLFILNSCVMTGRFSLGFDGLFTKVLVEQFLEYEGNREARWFVDTIQTQYTCCGVHSLNDFIDLSAIEGYDDAKSITPQTQIFSKCSSTWEYCAIPLSCCKTSTCTNFGALFDAKVQKNATKIAEQYFHQQGCLTAVSETFWFWKLSTWHIVFLVFVLVLHVAAGFFMQLSVSAYASLVESGLPDSEESFAWILDFGAPRAAEICGLIKPDTHTDSSQNPKNSETQPEAVSKNPGVTQRIAMSKNPETIKSSETQKFGAKILGKLGNTMGKVEENEEQEHFGVSTGTATATGTTTGTETSKPSAKPKTSKKPKKASKLQKKPKKKPKTKKKTAKKPTKKKEKPTKKTKKSKK
ncbi:unnamed protein product [Caenorhabditis angaria]|uniref:Tetraspanin n=1 Tax=Caenorhabditis angaria TaxID=860376 RepID=A0A9P1IB69_9PELO|nr:unnamed protein product [Caenorhabditis angaria]